MSGVACLLTAQHAAVRRMQLRPEPVDPAHLEMPLDVTERLVPVSGGTSIRVVERGPVDGPAVVLLHGITLSAEAWPFQLSALGDAGYRVVALDLRGHGRSRTGEGVRLTLDLLAADVATVLEAMDLSQVLIVGHSMGGMVALKLLGADPAARSGQGRIAALLMVASTANVVPRRGIPALGAAVAAARPVLTSAAGLVCRLPGPTLPAIEAAYTLARITFGTKPSPAQVMFTGEMASEVPVKVSAELLVDVIRLNAERELGDISMPVSVVVGDHDIITPPAQSEALAAAIPGALLTILHNCGHMVMLERPDDLNEAVADLAERAGLLSVRPDRFGFLPAVAGRSGGRRLPGRRPRRRLKAAPVGEEAGSADSA